MLATPRTPLKPEFEWLLQEPGPFMLREGLALHGVLEAPGAEDNPEIVGWAKEAGGDGSWYPRDAVPWCGLLVAIVAKRAGKEVPKQYLRARAWAVWGKEAPRAELGDVLVFSRGSNPAQGHVGIYVGETKNFYYVLGGNQGDAVSITRIAKSRLVNARRSYRKTPSNVRVIRMGEFGKLSKNEA